MRKAPSYFIGGRRGFVFDVVDGRKVSNGTEQAFIAELKAVRDNCSRKNIY